MGEKQINELSYAFSVSYVRLDLHFFVYFFYLLLLCFFLNDSTKEAEIHYRVKALSSTSEGEDVALVTCFVTLALKLSMKPTKWFPIDGFHRGYFIFLLKIFKMFSHLVFLI